MESRVKLAQEIEAQRLARHEAEQKAEAARLAATATRSPLEQQAWRQEQQARRQEEQTERALGALKGQYRSRFMATPGATREEFEAEWPTLLAQHRRDVAAGKEPAGLHSDPAKWGI